jgi:L-malate glycosyltransferase
LFQADKGAPVLSRSASRSANDHTPQSGRRLHVLFISSWYPVRDNPTHGVFNRYFAEAAALYHRVSVLHVASEQSKDSRWETVVSEEENILTVTVYYPRVTISIPLIAQMLKFRRRKAAFRAGYRKLESLAGRPDLMQLNVIMPNGIGALYLSKMYGLPYVISENWSGYTKEDGNYKGIVQKYLTRKIVSRAKFLMPTSDYLMEAMCSHGLEGRYRVIPNVVNTDEFVPVPRVPDGMVRFIHVSSLNDREKNVSGILRSFAKALEQRRELELVIAGTGEDEQLYRSLVKACGMEGRVIFTGRLMRSQLVKEINRCDALVMFSNYETFCLVIPEAFACGKPVITSAAGAIPSYMKPELGIMVPVKDEKALTDAILGFAENPALFDAGRIREYTVEHFGYKRVGARLSEIYKQALGEKGDIAQ